MHIYECTNKGSQTQEKNKTILQYEIQKKSHNNNTKKPRLYSSFICVIYIRT